MLSEVTTPMNIHQSSVRDYRYCPQKYNLSNLTQKRENLPHYFYGGTLYHALLEEHYGTGESIKLGRIKDIHQEVIEAEHYEKTMPWNHILEPVFYGSSLIDLVYEAVKYFDSLGFALLEAEREYEFKVGNVTFRGHSDLCLQQGTAKGIIDTKTSGMWDQYFTGKGFKRKVYSLDEVKFATQLNHYSWLEYVFNNTEIQFIGYFLPCNFIPYQRGAKAGKKEQSLFITQANTPEYLSRVYEADVMEVIEDIERSHTLERWPRSRPESFGKLDCTRCHFRNACLGHERPDFELPYEV